MKILTALIFLPAIAVFLVSTILIFFFLIPFIGTKRAGKIGDGMTDVFIQAGQSGTFLSDLVMFLKIVFSVFSWAVIFWLIF